MIWTYCSLLVHDANHVFRGDHGIPEKKFTFSTIVPTVSFDDEALLDAWGCSGPPEELGATIPAERPYARLCFRVPGGPPLRWLAKAAQKYPDLRFILTHATEATVVTGSVYHQDGVIRTSEVLGDIREVEDTIACICKGGKS